jgi:hypothetical protein
VTAHVPSSENCLDQRLHVCDAENDGKLNGISDQDPDQFRLSDLWAVMVSDVNAVMERTPLITGWVVEDAISMLPKKSAPSGVPIWERWWSGRSPTQAVIELIVIGVLLQFASFGILHIPWGFWPRLQPKSPASLQAILWQVDAGLVAIAFPVLFIVAQHSASLHDNVSALPIAEVLRRETGLVPMLCIAGLGFIRSGADSIWFPASSVLFFDFIFVFSATLVMLLVVSSKIFGLTNDPINLQKKAEELLQWRLRTAIDNSWAISKGNQDLETALEESVQLTLRYTAFSLTEEDNEWQPVFPLEDCVLTDVRAEDLVVAIESLSNQSFMANPEFGQPAEEGDRPRRLTEVNEEERVDSFLLKIVGDRLSPSTAFLTLRKSSFRDIDPVEAWKQIESTLRCAVNG